MSFPILVCLHTSTSYLNCVFILAVRYHGNIIGGATLLIKETPELLGHCIIQATKTNLGVKKAELSNINTLK